MFDNYSLWWLRVFSMKLTDSHDYNWLQILDSHDYNWLQILGQAVATINTVLTLFSLGFITWNTITVIPAYWANRVNLWQN